MEKKIISGALTITDGASEVNIPDVPRPLLEALYATITNAKDKLSQSRRRPSIVNIDDIEQLVAQLDQWSQPFDPISKRVRISISTYDSSDRQLGLRNSEYQSLQDFRREVPGKTQEVFAVVLNFEFLARNENSGLVNQCELTLDIRGSVRRSFYSASNDKPLGAEIFKAQEVGAQTLR